jgi:hypothetical protein
MSAAAQKQNIDSVLDSMKDLLRRIEDVFPHCLFLISGRAIDFFGADYFWGKFVILVT